MLAATLATEGECTMPPKLMWPESPLCADSLLACNWEAERMLLAVQLSHCRCASIHKG